MQGIYNHNTTQKSKHEIRATTVEGFETETSKFELSKTSRSVGNMGRLNKLNTTPLGRMWEWSYASTNLKLVTS
jgi:hypothetical protein